MFSETVNAIAELLIDLHITRFPLGGRASHAQSRSGRILIQPRCFCREVVAKTWNLALDAHLAHAE